MLLLLVLLPFLRAVHPVLLPLHGHVTLHAAAPARALGRPREARQNRGPQVRRAHAAAPRRPRLHVPAALPRHTAHGQPAHRPLPSRAAACPWGAAPAVTVILPAAHRTTTPTCTHAPAAPAPSAPCSTCALLPWVEGCVPAAAASGLLLLLLLLVPALHENVCIHLLEEGGELLDVQAAVAILWSARRAGAWWRGTLELT